MNGRYRILSVRLGFLTLSAFSACRCASGAKW